jgi:MAF protein
MQLILASQSPRRRELLTMLGVPYTTISTDTDESVEENYTPPEFVMELSRRKADSALNITAHNGNELIIAADTIVSYGDIILGKPSDTADAKRMLTMLSGSWHEVYTGITLTDGDKYITEAELTRVKFRNVDIQEIDSYVEKYNPLDKAGAYGIQEGAGLFVERIEGDYYNVMGLPMCKLSVMLKKFDVYLY